MPELTIGGQPGEASAQLLAYLRPSFYRINLYRLTGLAFQTGLEQLAAAMRTSLANPKAPLSPIPALTPAELEAAAGKKLDAQGLLLDEFFWLWPRPSKDGRDRALEAYARGAWLDAADFWRVECQQRSHDGLALHNVAVLFHMMALDLEALGEAGGAGDRQAKERDVWWTEAFRAWQSLRDHRDFWQLYSGRLAGRLPGNSHLEFAESIRASLLPAMASVNGQLAAKRCSAEEAWDRQVALLDATGYTTADLLSARRSAAEPFGRAIRAAVSEAIQRTRTDVHQGLAEATRLLHSGAGWLPFFTKVSLPTEWTSLSDEIAVAAMGCLEAYGRATGRWADLLAAGDTCLSMAQSPEARTRLNKHLVVFRTNYSTQVHKQRQVQLSALRNRCSTILASRTPARERLAHLIRCARSDLRELLVAGAGDPELDAEASGIIARAFRDLASALGRDGEPVLLTLDALSVAESLCRDVDVKKTVAEERGSVEHHLRKRQSDELSSVDSRYPLLTEHATPELYAENAFRITGLSVLATERDFSRHLQKAEMAERLGAGTAGLVGPLGIGASDAGAIRAAAQRMHDVERRLLDEFFWLWPLPEWGVDDRTGMSPLPMTQEQLTNAIDAWTLAASQKLDHGFRAHNLAVLHHLWALDLELRQRRTPLSVDECARRDRHWIEAFARWRESLETPALWEEVAQRIDDLKDPRLDRAVMVRLRSGLATAVLSTVSRLAVRAHDRDDAEVKRLTDLLTSSGLEPKAVRRAAEPFVDRVREKLSIQARDAVEKAKQAPTQAQLVSQELMSRAWASLETLSQLLGEKDSVAVHCHDEIALAAAGCLLQFARETKDWPAALKTLKEIEFLARGPSANETIQGYLKTASDNALFDRATAELDALSTRLQVIVAAASPPEDRLAQVRALLDGSPPLADDPGYLAARGDLFAHWLQQLALRFNNEDEKYALGLEAIRFALTLCKDPNIRQKLLDAEKAVGRNADAEAVGSRCNAVLASPASNSDKLRALGQCAQNQLQVLKRQHGDNPEFVDVVSDTVAGAIRSASIDLCNTDRQFATALEWLRFAASLARAADLRQRLDQDIVACQGLVEQRANIPPPPVDGAPKQRGFLTSCANCKNGILMLSHRDSHDRVFCSRVCLEWVNGPRGFCAKCFAETTDESAGGLSQVNGVGQTFMGSSDKCPSCGSVVCRKVVTAVWLPVFPQSRYRVLYSSPSTFYSRRVK